MRKDEAYRFIRHGRSGKSDPNRKRDCQVPCQTGRRQDKKAETLEQIENAKAEFAKPFPYEAELKEKAERLNALNIELNLDEKDTTIMDAEPEQSEEQPEKRSPAHVR